MNYVKDIEESEIGSIFEIYFINNTLGLKDFFKIFRIRSFKINGIEIICYIERHKRFIGMIKYANILFYRLSDFFGPTDRFYNSFLIKKIK